MLPLAALLLLPGCSGAEVVAAPAPEKVEVSIHHAEGAGRAALDRLAEIHEARRPNADVTIHFPLGVRPLEPTSDTFQASMGHRLFRWLTPGDVQLEPVTQGDWSIPHELLDVNSKDGVLYGVPISVIRYSTFFYNPVLLESYGIKVDELNQPGMAGVQALLDACATLATDPVNPIEQPFALGNIYEWTLDMLFWEALFPAIVGPDYYTRFWNGHADPVNEPELEDALAVLLELSQYFNADSAEIDFPEVLDRIAEGECAFGQQGEWGADMLVAHGYSNGAEFGVMPFPGTADIFLFSEDSFPIVAGTGNYAATQEFLNTVATEEAQIEVNRLKGTLPALTGIDIDAHPFNDAQKASYAHFTSASYRLPAVHGFKSDDVMPDLSSIMKVMIETQNTRELRAYVAANYALLAQ